MAKRLGAEFWQGHLESWAQSGLTQVAYCAKRGLNIKTFQRWRRNAVVSAKPSAVTLVPVSVGAPTGGGGVRLHSPGGWRIEVPDGSLPWLADVLRQLP